MVVVALVVSGLGLWGISRLPTGFIPNEDQGGAGANGRTSLGISVFSGMIASTCLAVLFVPSFLPCYSGWRSSLLREKRPSRCARKPAASWIT
jgi:multidrug efflux pump subunit AcrB